ncbi:glycosyltransferase [Rhodococcus sp. NPDC058521]|uniref:glycosyltransferase n=1 Tax=Rhodococcus sp. NPDC058521 TaxID=3346536 RepID=UPI00365ED17B
MKVVLPLAGTRGDVQPAVALGLELAGRGHDVVVGAPPNLVDFVTRTGLEARQCGPDVQKLYSSEQGQKALASGSSFKLMPMVAKQMSEYAERMDDEMIDVCKGADVIVSTMLTEDRSQSIAEAMNVPLVTMHSFPCRRNSLYTLPGGLPHDWNLPAPVIRASWVATEKLRGLAFMKYINALRSKLGLGKTRTNVESLLARDGVPELQLYDKAFVPGLAEEWGDSRPLMGFLDLPRSAREAVGELADEHADVLEWIEDGAPPIYFGFGSMPIQDTRAVLRMVDRITAELGQRALVSAGWSDLEVADHSTGDHVKVVGPLAHDLVFPHCLAAVHHGGIGTTYESLRAGLPTLVCSVSFDQPLWGVQVTKLGVGAHVKFAKLDHTALKTGIETVLSPGTSERARRFAEQLASGESNPAARVADVIEAAAR